MYTIQSTFEIRRDVNLRCGILQTPAVSNIFYTVISTITEEMLATAFNNMIFDEHTSLVQNIINFGNELGTNGSTLLVGLVIHDEFIVIYTGNIHVLVSSSRVIYQG